MLFACVASSDCLILCGEVCPLHSSPLEILINILVFSIQFNSQYSFKLLQESVKTNYLKGVSEITALLWAPFVKVEYTKE